MSKSPTFFERLGGSTPVFDPHHKFVTSPFFSSTVLAYIRGLVALYTFSTLLFTLIWQAVVLHTASGYFSYFTELTNIGICSYYWASFVQTTAYVRNGSGGRGKGYPLQKWGKTLQVLHMMLGTTIVAYPILVTVVFWGLLRSSSTFANTFFTWDNISLHALNTVFSLFEVLFTNSPPPSWFMVPFVVFVLALYLALAYVTHVTQGFYHPQKEHIKLAGYIIGILIVDLIIFSIVKGIMTLRERFSDTRRRRSQRSRSATGSTGMGGKGLVHDDRDDDEKKVVGDVERGFSPWTDLGDGETRTKTTAERFGFSWASLVREAVGLTSWGVDLAARSSWDGWVGLHMLRRVWGVWRRE
ncbi:hypothetical protein K435DRAFT_839632 [Dendrothele bispora CBS 962.96]|uniref:Uncharacterized protein n=1 Tax=Dendrothele bispora (strain CBS 962.96) TaxID=1314807 RepID=A0A4S8M0C2_DENBC|nr:hypothetical protein K435DRAFT_839632 [Dendrothele bispora CBS 962.96]